MQYMEVPGNNRAVAMCSDDACPCGVPGAAIPKGTGYMYVSPTVADFRRDCLSESEARAKIDRMSARRGAVITGGSGVFAPILLCELGARNRGLDLAVAAADAAHWWQTGRVPLRVTPLAQAGPAPKSAEPTSNFQRIANLVARAVANESGEALVPANLVETFQEFDARARSAHKAFQVFTAIIAIVALASAVVLGVRAGSFWAGVGVLFGVGIGLIVLFTFVDYLRARIGAAGIARRRGVSRDDAFLLLASLRAEHDCLATIAEGMRELASQPLSADLVKRLTEATMLTLVKMRLPGILTPTRELSARRKELAPLLEIVKDRETPWTGVSGKCRKIVSGAEGVLNARTRIFEVVDRMALTRAPGG